MPLQMDCHHPNLRNGGAAEREQESQFFQKGALWPIASIQKRSQIEGRTSDRKESGCAYWVPRRAERSALRDDRKVDGNARVQSSWARLLVERYNEMDFAPNAKPVKLDLVMKFRDEPDCYGHNNESAQFPQMKNPSRRLPVGAYRVKVHLTGVGVDKTFWFVLRNHGRGEPPRIEPEVV